MWYLAGRSCGYAISSVWFVSVASSYECVSVFQAETFAEVLNSSSDSDEKAILAMGILNTLDTIVTVMEDQTEVHTVFGHCLISSCLLVIRDIL